MPAKCPFFCQQQHYGVFSPSYTSRCVGKPLRADHLVATSIWLIVAAASFRSRSGGITVVHGAHTI